MRARILAAANALRAPGLTGPGGLLISAALAARDALVPLRGAPLAGANRLGGDVAQLGERLVRNEEVVGSIPIISTIPFSLGQAQRNPEL